MVDPENVNYGTGGGMAKSSTSLFKARPKSHYKKEGEILLQKKGC